VFPPFSQSRRFYACPAQAHRSLRVARRVAAREDLPQPRRGFPQTGAIYKFSERVLTWQSDWKT
jgi:hypothetical protein